MQFPATGADASQRQFLSDSVSQERYRPDDAAPAQFSPEATHAKRFAEAGPGRRSSQLLPNKTFATLIPEPDIATCSDVARQGRHGSETVSTEREQAAYLLRHLRIAWKIANKFERLKTRTSSLEASLDRLAIGTILIDGEKRVISTNRRAKTILATREVSLADGRLRTVEMKTRRQLANLLSALVGEDGGPPRGGAVAVGRFDGSALQIWGAPLQPLHGDGRPDLNPGDHARAILFILDPERNTQPPASFLKDAFGLTPAESALALALSRGETVDGYCEHTGISRNTARTHMRHIFEKLNIHKQNDLIRLLHGAHMFELGRDC